MAESTVHRYSRGLRGGFLLLEALIAISVFVLMIGSVVLALYAGQEGTIRSGDRIRAITLTENAIEAARAIRSASFDALTEGNHGTCLTEGVWTLCGTGSVTTDGFSTVLTIAPQGEDRVSCTAKTSWSIRSGRSGTVELGETLTDWRAYRAIGNWGNPVLAGTLKDAGLPLWGEGMFQGTVLYLAGSSEEGGPGIGIFETANLESPLRIAAGFTLGATAEEVLVQGTRLYLVSSETDREIQIFDVTDPGALSLEKLLGTIDVPGEGKARSIALYGTTLFVGAAESATENEFFAYDITDASAAVLLGGFDDTGGSFLDLFLRDGYAYGASTLDLAELRVLDVFDPSAITLAGGGGYGLIGEYDATALALTGTGLLLGRQSGEATEEAVLFDISKSPVPAPPPGPWYMELGGSVTDIAADPGGFYAFVTSDNPAQDLTVIDSAAFAQGGLPGIAVIDIPPEHGKARSVTYDPLRDILAVGTDTSVFLYRPGP